MTHSAPSRALGMRCMATPLSPIAAAQWPSPTSDTIHPTLRRPGHAAPAARGQTRERGIDWRNWRSRWRCGVKKDGGTAAKWPKKPWAWCGAVGRRALVGSGPDHHAGPGTEGPVIRRWGRRGGLAQRRRPTGQARHPRTPDLRHKVRHNCLSAVITSPRRGSKPRAAFNRPHLIYFFSGPRR